jgi:hypothetical protein
VVGVTSCTLGPIWTSPPIRAGAESRITVPEPTRQRCPIVIW